MGEGMKLLIGENVNILRGTFVVGQMSKFLTFRLNSPPLTGVFHKFSGGRGQSTSSGGNKVTSKGSISAQKGDTVV